MSLDGDTFVNIILSWFVFRDFRFKVLICGFICRVNDASDSNEMAAVQ